MMDTFDFWKKQHDSNSLENFNNDNIGQLWLKTKSIVRKELISEFIKRHSISLQSRKLKEQFEELFNTLKNNPTLSHNYLDEYIRIKNEEILKRLDKERLVSELYKLKVFEWGGDYQNSLDKYLVSHYVKAISSYDELMSKFENEISRAVQGYVLNSWYNHWSSILIEYIFKSHSKVLPTVGQIKYVDFFINNVPYDLKVTYFPSEYLKIKRRERGYPVELTYLKSKAREFSIKFDNNASNLDINYEIIEKFKDSNDAQLLDILDKIRKENLDIVNEAQYNSKILAKWFYENQGEMRFGSENRLFLVLIDTNDFSQSWKLKRNLQLLIPAINSFLDNFSSKNISDLKIEFNYPGKSQTFKSLADIIFVIK